MTGHGEAAPRRRGRAEHSPRRRTAGAPVDGRRGSGPACGAADGSGSDPDPETSGMRSRADRPTAPAGRCHRRGPDGRWDGEALLPAGNGAADRSQLSPSRRGPCGRGDRCRPNRHLHTPDQTPGAHVALARVALARLGALARSGMSSGDRRTSREPSHRSHRVVGPVAPRSVHCGGAASAARISSRRRSDSSRTHRRSNAGPR